MSILNDLKDLFEQSDYDALIAIFTSRGREVTSEHIRKVLAHDSIHPDARRNIIADENASEDEVKDTLKVTRAYLATKEMGPSQVAGWFE